MPKGTRLAVVTMVVVFGLLPPLLYWYALERGPVVSAVEARSAVAADPAGAVIVDVRPADKFASAHVPGAVSWPHDELITLQSPDGMPEQLKGRRLFLLCGGGIRSVSAARHLTDVGVANVWSVRGGMDEWIATMARRCVLCGFYRKALPEDTASPFYRESSSFAQWAAVITGFVLKPTYMLLALLLVVILRRRREPDLAALRWGLLFFFIGEAFCAVNYAVFEDGSYLAEYLHGYPMALAFGFTTFAVFEGLDRRVIKYSIDGEKCAVLGLCRSCAKYAQVPCALRRVFLLMIPGSLILALMPLSGEIRSGSYNTVIFGTLYNYSHPAVYQIFETRYCPVVAVLLFCVSFAALVFLKKNAVEWSKVFFAAGSGAMGFALLRWVIFSSFWGDLVWAATWEELTEMLYMAGGAWVLWLFRAGLFRESGAECADSD